MTDTSSQCHGPLQVTVGLFFFFFDSQNFCICMRVYAHMFSFP